MWIHPLQLRFIFGQLNLQKKSIQDRYKTHIGVATSLRFERFQPRAGMIIVKIPRALRAAVFQHGEQGAQSECA